MRILFVILVLIGFQTIAQNDSLAQLQFESNIDLSSNVIRSDFIRAFYNGSFIDSELKDNTSSNLRDINRLGLDLKLGSTIYTNDTLFKDFRMSFGVSHRQFLASTFSADFFNLIFYGNAGFENQEANLNGLTFRTMSYQSIDFGIYKKSGDDIFSISLGILKGSQYAHLKTEDANLFTGSNGSNISFTANGFLDLSDTSNTSVTAYNGTGVKIDFLYQKKTYDAIYGIKLSDVGVMAFNNQSIHYEIDTMYQFNGIEIDNLLSPSDSILTLETDLDSLAPQAVNQSIFISTPGRLTFYFKNQITKKSSLFVSVDKLFTHAYTMNVSADYTYELSKSFKPSAHLGYGGFTNEHFGIGFKIEKPKFELDLQARAIQGLISNGGLNHTFFGQLKWNL